MTLFHGRDHREVHGLWLKVFWRSQTLHIPSNLPSKAVPKNLPTIPTNIFKIYLTM